MTPILQARELWRAIFLTAFDELQRGVGYTNAVRVRMANTWIPGRGRVTMDDLLAEMARKEEQG